jgi:hypothetical protein
LRRICFTIFTSERATAVTRASNGGECRAGVSQAGMLGRPCCGGDHLTQARICATRRRHGYNGLDWLMSSFSG